MIVFTENAVDSRLGVVWCFLVALGVSKGLNVNCLLKSQLKIIKILTRGSIFSTLLRNPRVVHVIYILCVFSPYFLGLSFRYSSLRYPICILLLRTIALSSRFYRIFDSPPSPKI